MMYSVNKQRYKLFPVLLDQIYSDAPTSNQSGQSRGSCVVYQEPRWEWTRGDRALRVPVRLRRGCRLPIRQCSEKKQGIDGQVINPSRAVAAVDGLWQHFIAILRAGFLSWGHKGHMGVELGWFSANDRAALVLTDGFLCSFALSLKQTILKKNGYDFFKSR